MKVKALIERGNDGTYGVYIDLNEDRLTYGIHGYGETVEEAIEDFCNSYNEMKAYYAEERKPFVEIVFLYQYDVASFLNYYSKFISLAGLEKITGINQGQLSHYLNGHRNPSKKTIEKIERRLHSFANDLSQVHFV